RRGGEFLVLSQLLEGDQVVLAEVRIGQAHLNNVLVRFARYHIGVDESNERVAIPVGKDNARFFTGFCLGIRLYVRTHWPFGSLKAFRRAPGHLAGPSRGGIPRREITARGVNAPGDFPRVEW